MLNLKQNIELSNKNRREEQCDQCTPGNPSTKCILDKVCLLVFFAVVSIPNVLSGSFFIPQGSCVAKDCLVLQTSGWICLELRRGGWKWFSGRSVSSESPESWGYCVIPSWLKMPLAEWGLASLHLPFGHAENTKEIKEKVLGSCRMSCRLYPPSEGCSSPHSVAQVGG